MRKSYLLFSMGVGLVLALTLVLALPASAGPLLQGTPTASPGLFIPSATPAEVVLPSATPAGLVIPTATRAGLIIPTATPQIATPEPIALPPLDDEQLLALNLQPEDVPAQFAPSQVIGDTSIADLIADIRTSSPELADQMQALSEQYGWVKSVAITYSACDPSLPISAIYSEVAQLGSPEQARAFIDDDNVHAFFFEAAGFDLDMADFIHGWLLVGEGTSECFDQELEYSLAFEYWGVLAIVSVTADEATDTSLIEGLVTQMAQMVVQKIDALVPEPFPPTPSFALAVTEEVVTEEPLPTEEIVTEEALPTEEVGAVTLEDLDSAMPSLAELGLPEPTFALNEELSGGSTLEELVTETRAQGLTEMANAIEAAGQANGLGGLMSRVYDTGSACPATVGLSVSIETSIFPGPEQAQAYLADAAIRQAWLNTGLFTRYDITGDTVTVEGFYSGHPCGSVTLDGKAVAHGRFIVNVMIIGNPLATRADLVSAVNMLSDYAVLKLDMAGLR